MMDMDEAVSRIVELESGRAERDEPPAAIVRWALVAEVLEPGDDNVTVESAYSEGLPAWQLKGLAWVLGKHAEDALI